jgi:hypothetical protein
MRFPAPAPRTCECRNASLIAVAIGGPHYLNRGGHSAALVEGGRTFSFGTVGEPNRSKPDQRRNQIPSRNELPHPRSQSAFESILETSGVRCMKLPSRSPNLNAYAERFVRSIRSECVGQIFPIGEGRLRRAVRESVDHYHDERNHQGPRPIDSKRAQRSSNGRADRMSRKAPWASAVLPPSGVRLGGVLTHCDGGASFAEISARILQFDRSIGVEHHTSRREIGFERLPRSLWDMKSVARRLHCHS